VLNQPKQYLLHTHPEDARIFASHDADMIEPALELPNVFETDELVPIVFETVQEHPEIV